MPSVFEHVERGRGRIGVQQPGAVAAGENLPCVRGKETTGSLYERPATAGRYRNNNGRLFIFRLCRKNRLRRFWLLTEDEEKKNNIVNR